MWLIKGGYANECTFVGGLVFRKSLSHRNMLQSKDNPRILLLAGGIEFERLDCPRLLSLDTLLEQENKYLEILVGKIMSLNPGMQIY